MRVISPCVVLIGMLDRTIVVWTQGRYQHFSPHGGLLQLERHMLRVPSYVPSSRSIWDVFFLLASACRVPRIVPFPAITRAIPGRATLPGLCAEIAIGIQYAKSRASIQFIGLS